jgi:hypothetical protein
LFAFILQELSLFTFENFSSKGFTKSKRTPHILVMCGHTYCLECSTKLIAGNFKCPTCRGQPRNSVKNFAYSSMLEDSKMLVLSDEEEEDEEVINRANAAYNAALAAEAHNNALLIQQQLDENGGAAAAAIPPPRMVTEAEMVASARAAAAADPATLPPLPPAIRQLLIDNPAFGQALNSAAAATTVNREAAVVEATEAAAAELIGVDMVVAEVDMGEANMVLEAEANLVVEAEAEAPQIDLIDLTGDMEAAVDQHTFEHN